ncbi:MAG: ATP-binding cassette domain-containing protein, partial [Merdibacter sp.]
NGTDVRQLDLQQLRSIIGYVAQKAVLFRGTIAENIRFGKKDASEEEVRHAAEVAQACEFISAKPKQFEERIVEGASNVSGGQKQRLSIARAIVRHPQIYIYDDSFSALDFATDAKLRKALKGEVKDAIMVIVAQRVSTIRRRSVSCSMAGRRTGTHSELLKTCRIYHEIASSQLVRRAAWKIRRQAFLPVCVGSCTFSDRIAARRSSRCSWSSSRS